MAKLYISEYVNTPTFIGQSIPTGVEPAAATQVVAITGASVQSAAFGPYTKFIRVNVDETCSIAMDANPIADTDKARMVQNTTEFFGVSAGHKLAVISNT